MLETLSYITLAVDDVPAAEKFYREQLGFKVQYRRKESNISCIELGGYNLMLEGVSSESDLKPGQISFVFEVDSREKFDRELKSTLDKGADPVKGPDKVDGGKIKVVFLGANGERIELIGPDSYKEE